MLASKLYFHGHPINREEARTDMGLKIAENVPPALETAMWKLYLDYEGELKNTEIFDPMAEIYRNSPPPVPIVPAQPGVILPHIIPPGTSATTNMKLALVESARISSSFDVSRRVVVVSANQQGEPIVRAEVLDQRWTHHSVLKPVQGSKKRSKG